MAIVIQKQPDVIVTESELARYSDEYRQAYSHFCGTPPSLEDFIRNKIQRSNEDKRYDL